jgi:hypothetical protein
VTRWQVLVGALVLGVVFGSSGASAGDRPPGFEKLWESGRIEDAVALRARQLAAVERTKGAIFGRVVREDGRPLTQEDRDEISILPRLLAFNDYWSPEGYFFVELEPGAYRVSPRGSRWTAETKGIRVVAGAVTGAGTVVLRQRDLSVLARVKVRLNVRKSGGAGAAGIPVRVDKLDKNAFTGVTDAEGNVEVSIPRVPGRWKVRSAEPGYAEVWAFFEVRDETDRVDLGRFEITRLKQVTVRWLMPRKEGERTLRDQETVGGTVVLRTYDEYESPAGTIGRNFSFAAGKMVDVTWDEPYDLDLVQSGDGEILVEIEPGLMSTTLLEFFPGTFARVLDRKDRSGMADLGEVPLESLPEVPIQLLRQHSERGGGLPVIEGHTYALRSRDGKRHVLLRVEKIEDQPLD